jgi:hypothetical protein
MFDGDGAAIVNVLTGETARSRTEAEQ